jgi:hypothetical protein
MKAWRYPVVRRLAALSFCLAYAVVGLAPAAQSQPANQIMNDINPLSSFQVIEFRRYTIKDGERENFIRYFETYFPEAFEQLGALAFGQFRERGNTSGFVWLRGFHSRFDRPVANAAFYFGPLWREHSLKMNSLMKDSDNVLLLQPLAADTEVTVLPAVDPVTEKNGVMGIAVAQILPLKNQPDEALSARLRRAFSSYRVPGVREAGILITLDAPNNFPQLPVRNDGPFLVWLGILRDEESLKESFTAAAQRVGEILASEKLLRDTPELLVLEPTPRSRLRWFPGWQ